MTDINSTFFISVIIILFGFVLKSTGLIPEKEGKVITKIILNVTLPTMIIGTVSTVTLNYSLGLLPFIAIGYCFLMLGLGSLIGRKQIQMTRGLTLMLIAGFNIAQFAYPIIEGIWGTSGVQILAMFDIGNGIFVFGITYAMGVMYGVPTGSRQSSTPVIAAGMAQTPNPESSTKTKLQWQRVLKRVGKSVPLWSYIIALLLATLQIELPSFLTNLFSVMGRANMALVLLALGIYLNFRFERSQWALILKVIGIRYAIGIGIGLFFYFFLPFDMIIRKILFICLILPIAGAVIAFVPELGYDEKITGTMTNLTIVISFGIIWVFLAIFGI